MCTGAGRLVVPIARSGNGGLDWNGILRLKIGRNLVIWLTKLMIWMSDVPYLGRNFPPSRRDICE